MEEDIRVVEYRTSCLRYSLPIRADATAKGYQDTYTGKHIWPEETGERMMKSDEESHNMRMQNDMSRA